MGAAMTLSLLSAAAAVSIIVLTVSKGNSGLAGETSIIISNCASGYFAEKYNNLNIINRVVFVSSSLAALISLQLALTASGWFCKQCNSSTPPSIPTARMFFWSSCLALSAVPPLGYYLSIFAEAGNCSNSVQFTDIIIILGIAAILMGLALTLSLLFLCKNSPRPS
jgi:hypothetical protein